jgi:UDP-3-O-[3-hydroxymyristoyl] glucosamine N-acyltransferase
MPGSFVGNHTIIGKNCVIHPNVTIYDYCVIGDNVIIHSGSVIGADAYYFQRRSDSYKKFESFGRVVIEDDVEIGALCSIDKGVTSDTTIRRGTKMDNHCQVGHDSYIGRNCLIGSHAAIAGVTRIEDDVILWGRVCVNKDLVIGEGAVVLATSAVDKNIEPGKAVFGVPAQDVRKQWREQAAMRKLPDFLREYYNKKD